MGFRFRKSINLGGFRLNFSKSGIGYSYGVKGFRITKKAGGGTRTTLSVPGTGISYAHDSRKSKSTKSSSQIKETPVENVVEPYYEEIESAPNDFIDSLNEATKKNKTYRILKIICIVGLLIGVALFASGAFNKIVPYIVIGAVFFLGSLICFLVVPKRAEVSLDCEFGDKEQEKAYADVLKGIENLFDSSELIINDFKQDLQSLDKARELLNSVLVTDITIPSMSLQGLYVFFFPNVLAVFQKEKWVAVEYSQIGVNFSEIEFKKANLSDDTDMQVLYKTYLHANKDGSRDRRYNDNPLISICAYAQTCIKSSSGLNIVLINSSRDKGKSFFASVNDYVKLFSK